MRTPAGTGPPADQTAQARAAPPSARERFGEHEPRRTARNPVANQKQPGCGVGSRSAFIVPATAGNRAHRDPSEGRGASGAENHCRDTREGTLSPANLSTNRQRIANLARARPGVALSSLHHVIDLDWMREAYRLTRKDGAPGIDGVTAADYEANLEANLLDLLDRIRSAAITHRRCAGPTSRKRTARDGRSASRPSKTRWRNALSPWCWRRSTSRTSSPARMASGPAARPTRRSTLCAPPAWAPVCGGASMSTSRVTSTRSTTAICGTSSTSESRTASFDG